MRLEMVEVVYSYPALGLVSMRYDADAPNRQFEILRCVYNYLADRGRSCAVVRALVVGRGLDAVEGCSINLGDLVVEAPSVKGVLDNQSGRYYTAFRRAFPTETEVGMDAKLIEKMQKILALAKLGVEGEAVNAAAILQRFLTEHNLSVADLEVKGTQQAPKVGERGHDLGKAAFKWKLDLAESIAKFYYCHPLVNRYARTVVFVGRPDNVESLIMLYAWVIGQIKRLAGEDRKAHQTSTGEHVDPLRWQVNFGIGAVQRLEHRLEEQHEKQQAEMSRNAEGDVTALTLHHEAENNDYLEQKTGRRFDGKLTKHEQEQADRYAREAQARKDWLARDPAGFYDAHPWMRPETEEQRAARVVQVARDAAEYEKAEKRRAARRARYEPRERGERYDPEAARRDEQSHAARSAGRIAAEKINLQPFLNGEVPIHSSKRIKE